MASSSPTKMRLKLLIDTKSERVLFAEASKEFVDFLFNLLRLPLGTVIRLLTKNAMVGCLGKLYESIENLSDDYFLQPNQDKEVLLRPSGKFPGFLLPANNGRGDNKSSGFTFGSSQPAFGSSPSRLFGSSPSQLFGSSSFALESHRNYVTEGSSSGSGEGGFVKRVVTYMVTDDLVVQPLSTISNITLLNKFNIKDIDSLEERTVEFKKEDGIKLLKAALESTDALTSVFLKNMGS